MDMSHQLEMGGRRPLWPHFDHLLRPVIGFNRPRDVLKDPGLDRVEKRAILSSWASDACAVPDRPTLRQAPGADMPVPLLEVLEALARLDEVRADA
ncbi:hypothetical protein [Phenylobacterium aquaticum]|nr:hypothetical protein [Phenylobacterium aquaticum]